jgi:hypothetical protein
MMATFQDIKNNINTPQQPQVLNKVNETQKESTQFELEEARYMLNLIAKSDFKGSDVQVVYNIAFKLQDIIKENKINNG